LHLVPSTNSSMRDELLAFNVALPLSAACRRCRNTSWRGRRRHTAWRRHCRRWQTFARASRYRCCAAATNEIQHHTTTKPRQIIAVGRDVGISAGMTGLCYAESAGRFPESSGGVAMSGTALAPLGSAYRRGRSLWRLPLRQPPSAAVRCNACRCCCRFRRLCWWNCRAEGLRRPANAKYGGRKDPRRPQRRRGDIGKLKRHQRHSGCACGKAGEPHGFDPLGRSA
jgi:hypothetical protein